MEHGEDWKPLLVVPGNPDARKVLPGTVAHSVSVVEALKPEAEPVYGLPDKKKYPMPDRDHVLSAIRFFNYVDPTDEERLAKAILKRMRELNVTGIKVGDVNRFKKYYDRSTTLAHHGVRGMKWGVWNEETRARYTGIHKDLSSRQLDNTLKKAKASNLEKWGKDEDHNTLYITGYSGSGKSTVAQALAEKNDKVIRLDTFVENVDKSYTGFRDPDFVSHLDKVFPDWKDVVVDNIDKPGYEKKVRKFDEAIDSFSKQQYRKNNRVIVEGVQILDGWLKNDPSKYGQKPMIIMKTNAPTSMSRAFKRSGRGGLVKGLVSLDDPRNHVDWYRNNHDYRKQLEKNYDHGEFETNLKEYMNNRKGN